MPGIYLVKEVMVMPQV